MTGAEIEDLDPPQLVYRDWLAARRADNQKTSLLLHSLIRKHAIRISQDAKLVLVTQGLVTAASALWRAAFLSDRLAVYEDVEDDDFLLTDQLIATEFTGGPSGRSMPDWSFFSHMSKAREALVVIAGAPEMNMASRAEIPAWIGLSHKECWVRHQALLDRAIEQFAAVLGN